MNLTRTGYTSTNPINVITCPPRTGSSALGRVINSSGEAIITHEEFIWFHPEKWKQYWPNAQGKVVIDKWPIFYLTRFDELYELHGANHTIRLVYLTRDPRDQTYSRIANAHNPENCNEWWVSNEPSQLLGHSHPTSWWFVSKAWEDVKRKIDQNGLLVDYMEIRYEDLTGENRLEYVQRLFAFLGLTYTKEVAELFTRDYKPTRTSAWKDDPEWGPMIDRFYSGPRSPVHELVEYWGYTDST